jgi:hypothetical protein
MFLLESIQSALRATAIGIRNDHLQDIPMQWMVHALEFVKQIPLAGICYLVLPFA